MLGVLGWCGAVRGVQEVFAVRWGWGLRGGGDSQGSGMFGVLGEWGTTSVGCWLPVGGRQGAEPPPGTAAPRRGPGPRHRSGAAPDCPVRPLRLRQLRRPPRRAPGLSCPARRLFPCPRPPLRGKGGRGDPPGVTPAAGGVGSGTAGGASQLAPHLRVLLADPLHRRWHEPRTLLRPCCHHPQLHQPLGK